MTCRTKEVSGKVFTAFSLESYDAVKEDIAESEQKQIYPVLMTSQKSDI